MPIPLFIGVQMNDTKQLIQDALDQGWRLQRKGRHLILYAPQGKGIVVVARSGSDWREIQNVRSYLKHYGFKDRH